MILLRTVITTLAISLAIPFSLPEKKCRCGMEPDRVVYYQAPPADVSFPNPHIESISKVGETETFRVAYTAAHRNIGDTETLIHSSDGGLRWVIENTQPRQLPIFSAPILIYRLAGNEEDVLERSRDGGAHWERPQVRVNGKASEQFAQEAAGNVAAYLSIGLAAVSPRSPERVYACLEVKSKPNVKSNEWFSPKDIPGMYVSSDGGDNWLELSSELDGFSSEGYCTLGISQSNPDRMIAPGRKGLVISGDGGKTWKAVGEQAVLERPAEIQEHAEAPTSTKQHGHMPGREWTPGWAHLNIKQIVFQLDDENVIYLVTNKGLYKTEDGALTWCLLDTGISRLYGIGSVFVDDSRPGHLFLQSNTKLLVTEDGGCHFKTFFDWDKYEKENGRIQ